MRRFCVSGVVAAIIGTCGTGWAEMSPEQRRLFQQSTALVHGWFGHYFVQGPGGIGLEAKGFGTAFCVDPSGIFVTTVSAAHPSMKEHPVRLRPGTADEKELNGRLLRHDKETGLCILEVQGLKDIPALPLGSTQDLVETQELTVIGVPYRADAIPRRLFPSLAAGTRRIASLAKRKGELVAIDFDRPLDLGNSGAPVLDSKGRVVAIVPAADRAVQSAIPVEILARILATPEVIVSPASLPFGERLAEREFAVRVIPLAGAQPEYTVEATLQTGSERRRFNARHAGNGTHTFRTTAISPAGARQLQLAAKYDSDEITCRVDDTSVVVGGKPLQLSNILRVERGDRAQVVLASGQCLEGVLHDPAIVRATLGNAPLPLNLAQASLIRIEPLDKPLRAIDYEIAVQVKGVTVARTTGSIEITGVPTTPATAPSGMSGAMAEVRLEQSKVVREMPCAINRIVPGAGGRLLLLHLKKLRQLAVFDVTQSKIARYVPLPSDDITYAAGAEKLIVIARDHKLVQRWDLRTWEKEATASLEEGWVFQDVALGHASIGPALVMTKQKPCFLDLSTLKFLDVKFNDPSNWRPHYRMVVEASADGSLFTGWQVGISPAGMRTITLDGNAARGRWSHADGGLLHPSFDGDLIFTSEGIYPGDMSAAFNDEAKGRLCLPSYHPGYFMILEPDASEKPGTRREKVGPPKLSIAAISDRRVLTTLNDLDELGPVRFHYGNQEPWIDQRIHFYPTGKLLLTINESCDRILLRRLDVDSVLAGSGRDYLLVTSIPSHRVRRGSIWRYAPEVKSKRGGVQISLSNGPAAMSVSKAGVVEWTVPPDFAPGEIKVVLEVKDASGQEMYHTFKLTVVP